MRASRATDTSSSGRVFLVTNDGDIGGVIGSSLLSLALIYALVDVSKPGTPFLERCANQSVGVVRQLSARLKAAVDASRCETTPSNLLHSLALLARYPLMVM